MNEQICECNHSIDDHVGNGELECCLKCDCEFYAEKEVEK